MRIISDDCSYKGKNFCYFGDISIDEDLSIDNSIVIIGDLKCDVLKITYNLNVIGNITANKIICKGDLKCEGNLNSNSIEVQGSLICDGLVYCSELICDNNMRVTQLECKGPGTVSGTLFVENDLIIDDELITESLTCLGVTYGLGKIKAKVCIVYETLNVDIYSNSIFEISQNTIKTIDFKYVECENCKKLIVGFEPEYVLSGDDNYNKFIEMNSQINNKVKNMILNIETYDLSYDEISKILDLLSLNFIEYKEQKRLFDNVLALSELNRITKLKDYLLLLQCYDNLFIEIKEISIVRDTFNILMEKADKDISEMKLEIDYDNIFELLEWILLLEKYSDKLLTSIKKEYINNLINLYSDFFDITILTTNQTDQQLAHKTIETLRKFNVNISSGRVRVNCIAIDKNLVKIGVSTSQVNDNPVVLSIGHNGELMKDVTNQLNKEYEGLNIRVFEWFEDLFERAHSVIKIKSDLDIHFRKEDNLLDIYVDKEEIPGIIGKNGSNIRCSSMILGIPIKVNER